MGPSVAKRLMLFSVCESGSKERTTAVNRTLVDRVIGTGTVKPVEEVYIQPQVEGLSIRTLKARFVQ